MSAMMHPIQTECCHRGGIIPTYVTARAYEVYCELFGKQEAMITGNCRGGFGILELIAFLYVYGFPRTEWRARVDEALTGAKVGR